jgi:uncharacterized membrane protein
VADLIAIGDDDEETAEQAAEEVYPPRSRPGDPTLFLIPVFGLAVGGVLGALFGTIDKIGIDRTFQQQVRDMLQPGTSALFLVVDKVTPDKAVEALSKYGGRVLKTSLSEDAEQQLQEALAGAGTAAGAAA